LKFVQDLELTVRMTIGVAAKDTIPAARRTAPNGNPSSSRAPFHLVGAKGCRIQLLGWGWELLRVEVLYSGFWGQGFGAQD
jgi:hypothetical protein